MDLRWFQDFLTLAECGQFTTAAELRHVSQSAFSRRIQSLETWAGTALIDRSCFPLRLTTAGEQFRSNAAEIVRKVVDARGEAGVASHEGAVLRVAMPHCLATSHFPGWCIRWKDESAVGSLRLHVGNVHDSVEWLAAGVVDLLVCFRHAAEDIQLDPQAYMRTGMAPDGLRLFRPAAMDVDEAALYANGSAQRYPYVSYAQGAYFRRLVELACGDLLQRPVLERVCETDFVDGARTLVSAGVGLAWLPDSSAKASVDAGQIVAIKDRRCAIPMQICMYARRQGPAQEPVERVFNLYTQR
ncbi:HTH-type transcriptional regulator gltC [Achromobacter insolitus]|uniref:LysR family transcriptional regulator n=1 Tax=Achromobacter insolitus TaxID=217204 RepID=UPI0009729CD5|nr:LysR family transcriptional regulator [Achromobacter insolitus]APX74997.1 LysR family transcriptional regulator [Achromobacter insolitus]OWT58643.1 LysR family transcriptional regulator [Achromobacter insolitus]CAB3714934.1 HTH-type transcriptional regulator YjiE [Achromobacter insolitus]VEG67850.1 HTH-type transcriptional regulator gltC [Achromobacter insolitus]